MHAGNGISCCEAFIKAMFARCIRLFADCFNQKVFIPSESNVIVYLLESQARCSAKGMPVGGKPNDKINDDTAALDINLLPGEVDAAAVASLLYKCGWDATSAEFLLAGQPTQCMGCLA